MFGRNAATAPAAPPPEPDQGAELEIEPVLDPWGRRQGFRALLAGRPMVAMCEVEAQLSPGVWSRVLWMPDRNTYTSHAPGVLSLGEISWRRPNGRPTHRPVAPGERLRWPIDQEGD